jgi:hypothetical protein
MQRKHLFILVIAALGIKPAFSQNFFFGFGTGYGLSLSPQNLTSKINHDGFETSSTAVRGSFGKGTALSCYFGYKKNENIATEIAVSYLYGARYKGYYKRETEFDEETTLSGNMLRLIPGVRLTLNQDKFRLYAKLGLIIRTSGSITFKGSHYDIPTNTTTEVTWKYSKGMSLGASACFGVIKNLNEKLQLYSELVMISQSWGPAKGEIIEYQVNGVDNLPNLTPNQKDIDFVNNYATNYASSTSAYSHSKQLKQYHPFSSIGIQIGVCLNLGKQK